MKEDLEQASRHQIPETLKHSITFMINKVTKCEIIDTVVCNTL